MTRSWLLALALLPAAMASKALVWGQLSRPWQVFLVLLQVNMKLSSTHSIFLRRMVGCFLMLFSPKHGGCLPGIPGPFRMLCYWMISILLFGKARLGLIISLKCEPTHPECGCANVMEHRSWGHTIRPHHHGQALGNSYLCGNHTLSLD